MAIFHGELTTIRIGKQSVYTVASQLSCTCTISEDYIRIAGNDAKTTANKRTLKGWSIEGSALMTVGNFENLFRAMIRDQSDTKFLSFKTKEDNAYYRYITGEAIITRLTFAGQGKGLVRINFSAIGNGKPTSERKTT